MTEQNPYSAPESNLDTPKAITGTSKIHIFDRFGSLIVFLLSGLTLNLYMIFWLHNRTTKLNTIADKKISIVLLYVMLVTGVVTFMMIVIPESFFEGSMILTTAILIALPIYAVTYFIILYKIRARLINILNDDIAEEEHVHVGVIMTFFFNVIYLQYKINQGIDELPSA
jgi:hypothetical protein